MTASTQGALALVSNTPSIFNFGAHAVRIVMIDGDPWFVASEVCSALDLDSTAIRKLDDDEKGLHSMQTLGGAQQIAIVSESGMYTLVLRCRDALKAGTVPYRFRKWVTSEVLPSIRKTGGYGDSQRARQASDMARAASHAVEQQIYDAVMDSEADPHLDRWLIALNRHPDHGEVQARVMRVPRDAYVLSESKLIEGIRRSEVGPTFTDQQLTDIAQAAMERLRYRIDRAAERARSVPTL